MKEDSFLNESCLSCKYIYIYTQLNDIVSVVNIICQGSRVKKDVAWSLVGRVTFVYICHKHVGQCW